MLPMTRFAYLSTRLLKASGMTHMVCMMRVSLPCCAILIASIVCATPAMATSTMAVKTECKFGIIKVGQQQSGQPLRLRGMFVGYDQATRRLELAPLDWLAFSWKEAMRSVEVDKSVGLNALAPGMAVTVTLTRKSNGEYFVSELKKS